MSVVKPPKRGLATAPGAEEEEAHGPEDLSVNPRAEV